MSKKEIEKAVDGLVEQQFGDLDVRGPEPEPEDFDADEEMDFDEVFDKFLDGNNIRVNEPRLRDVEQVANALGYDSLEYFLMDNPGAGVAIFDWIREFGERVPEWKDSLRMED